MVAAVGGVAMPSHAAEIDLNGRWKPSHSDKIIEVRHTGNTIVGGNSFRGTLSGYEFSGEIWLTADGCPNLEGLAPATGVVSASQNTITFTTGKAFRFLTKKCAKTGEEYTDSTSYTRIRDESPSAPTTPPPMERQQPIEELQEVEAKIEKTPTDDDLLIIQKPAYPKKDWGEATIERLTGGADLLLPGADPNADDSWKEAREGDVIPYGAKLFTSYASEATIHFSHGPVILILALSEVTMGKPETYGLERRVELGTGDVRFKATQGDFRTDWQVSTPNTTASPTGTDFFASYDKNTGLTIYEMYDGSLAVTSILTGETKTISSSYGAPIKRIEVTKGGAMTEQIAIPKDEWQKNNTTKRSSAFFWIAILAVGGGIGYFVYRKRGLPGSKKKKSK